MMLWRRVWWETRARFLISLAGAVGVCSLFIHHTHGNALPDTATVYYPNTFFYAHQYLMGIWILGTVLLGMGGLVREKALGSAPFTLTLPVTRGRLCWVRIALGLLQVAALGVIPWLVIALVAWWGGHAIEPSQAAYYVTLLLGAGLVYFALAVLTASLVEGEYTAPAVTFGVVILTSVLPGMVTFLRPYSVLRLMGGSASLDRETYLLRAPVPWNSLLAITCLAAVLLIASVHVVRHREF